MPEWRSGGVTFGWHAFNFSSSVFHITRAPRCLLVWSRTRTHPQSDHQWWQLCLSLENSKNCWQRHLVLGAIMGLRLSPPDAIVFTRLKIWIRVIPLCYCRWLLLSPCLLKASLPFCRVQNIPFRLVSVAITFQMQIFKKVQAFCFHTKITRKSCVLLITSVLPPLVSLEMLLLPSTSSFCGLLCVVALLVHCPLLPPGCLAELSRSDKKCEPLWINSFYSDLLGECPHCSDRSRHFIWSTLDHIICLIKDLRLRVFVVVLNIVWHAFIWCMH